MSTINVNTLSTARTVIVVLVILAFLVVSFATDRVILFAGTEFGLLPSEKKISAADYIGEWREIKSCETQKITDLPFQEIPSIVMAYYKINTKSGEELIIPWGINQYGDSWQTNGVLLDFEHNVSEDQVYLYIRTPCLGGKFRGNDALVHLGRYKDRYNDKSSAILSIKQAKFLVMMWK